MEKSFGLQFFLRKPRGYKTGEAPIYLRITINGDTTLNSKTGKAFDKAYIDNEVVYHKAVISVIETILIPQAQNSELKDLLQNVLPALRTHLEHAEMVQSKFNGHAKKMASK